MSCTSIYAHCQSDTTRWRSKYLNIGFVESTLKQDGLPKLKSNYGLSFTVGNTYYFHRKPIAKCLKFGLDISWIDINYANYNIEHITLSNKDRATLHQGELSLQIGPSITIKPSKNIYLMGYFRFAPSLSALYINDNFSAAYSNVFLGGLSMSYKFIGVGAEYRIGKCNQPAYVLYDEDNETKKNSTFNVLRAYINFRF